MKLGDFLGREFLLPDLKAVSKPEVLAELVSPLGEAGSAVDPALALRVLLDREQLGSTGIGDGVAIPHGKMQGLDRILLTVGRSRTGVDFAAQDLKPCHIFFMALAPEQSAGMHLRILAHISRLLKDEGFRRAFMDAADGDALWTLLRQA